MRQRGLLSRAAIDRGKMVRWTTGRRAAQQQRLTTSAAAVLRLANAGALTIPGMQKQTTLPEQLDAVVATFDRVRALSGHATLHRVRVFVQDSWQQSSVLLGSATLQQRTMFEELMSEEGFVAVHLATGDQIYVRAGEAASMVAGL